MALSARPASATSSPSIPTGHTGAGGRNIASVSFGQIDEVSLKTGVHPDANFLGFSNFGERRRDPEPQAPRHLFGNLDTPSSTFASLMSQEQSVQDLSRPGDNLKGSFRNMLSKAISAYEGTADVIHGARKPRGTALSISM